MRLVASSTAWQLAVSGIIIMSFIVTVVELDFAHGCDDQLEGSVEEQEACRQILLPFRILDYGFTLLVSSL